MATLAIKPLKEATLACYSERGQIAYLIYRVAVQPNRLLELLQGISFPDGIDGPFKELTVEQLREVTLFSELHFGTQGFGLPDAAIFCVADGQPTLVFIEAKMNSSYARASRGNEYTASIRGQLELKFRAMWSFKQNWTRVNPKGEVVISESRAQFEKVYPDDPNVGRELVLRDGVKEIFERYIRRCELRSMFFVAATRDSSSPLVHDNTAVLPRSYDGSWESTKWRFGWINAAYIQQVTE